MSNLTNAFIQPSPKFRDAFEVVAIHCEVIVEGLAQRVRREVIPCANLATARSVRDGINNGDGVPRPLPVADKVDLEQTCGCLTGGLGYTPAVTWALTGRVERVHNWATARKLAGDYPACHALT